MKSRRFVLLLYPKYSVELDALNMIKAAPAREEATFIRALLLLGFEEIKKEKACEHSPSVKTEGGDGTLEQEMDDETCLPS